MNAAFSGRTWLLSESQAQSLPLWASDTAQVSSRDSSFQLLLSSKPGKYSPASIHNINSCLILERLILAESDALSYWTVPMFLRLMIKVQSTSHGFLMLSHHWCEFLSTLIFFHLSPNTQQQWHLNSELFNALVQLRTSALYVTSLQNPQNFAMDYFCPVGMRTYFLDTWCQLRATINTCN